MPLVVALLRGRPRVALAVGAIILGANMTTEVLKHLLSAPRAGSLFPGGVAPVSPRSLPSGHSTAAMSLALASVLAAPARLRPAVAALGASLAIAVGYSLLATGVHFPSDVSGGFLVADDLDVVRGRGAGRGRALAPDGARCRQPGVDRSRARRPGRGASRRAGARR